MTGKENVGNVGVESGNWVVVPPGMVIAPGTYVDDEGYLRFGSNDSYAVWHRNIKGVECERFSRVDKDGAVIPIKKEEIMLVEGAPKCRYCYGE